MNQTMKKFSKIEKAVSKLAKAIREVGTDNVFDDINIKSSLRMLNGKDVFDCSLYLNGVTMASPMLPTPPKYPITAAPLRPDIAYNNVFKTDRDKAADGADPILANMSQKVSDALKSMNTQLSENERKMAYANKFVAMVTSLLPAGHLEGSLMLMGDLLEALDCEELDKARDLIRQHWVLDKEKEEAETDADTDEDAGEVDPNAPTGPWEGSGY